MSDWYLCDERDCNEEVWMKDHPSLSVFREEGTDWWHWHAWSEVSPTTIIAEGEFFASAIEAMQAADKWESEGCKVGEGME